MKLGEMIMEFKKERMKNLFRQRPPPFLVSSLISQDHGTLTENSGRLAFFLIGARTY